MTDFPDWQAPQAHASAIAGTGVPLLTLSALVGSKVNQPIGPSGNISVGPVDWNQPGYDLLFNLKCPPGTAVPFGQVQTTWFDKGSGVVVSEDTWIMPAGQSPSPWAMFGRGPSRGNQLAVTLTNLDSAATLTGSIYAAQHSRPYTKDDWQYDNLSLASVAVPGNQLPTFPADSSVLGLLDLVTIPASSSSAYLFGMHSGLVNVGYEVNTGSAGNLSIRIRPKPDTSYSGHNIIYSATQPPANFQVAGPRAPLGVVVANSATTAMVLSLSAIRAD